MPSRRTVLATAAAVTFGHRLVAGTPAQSSSYNGPNVILIRFGGGVRRRETIEAASTHAPYLLHGLAPRGVLIPDMRIEQLEGLETSHAEGTINILTGRYLAYADHSTGLFDDRLKPTVPTLFEYLRKSFSLSPHEALLINGEDRPQEEYLVAGAVDHKGISVPAEMLSLYRFKLHKLNRIMAEGKLSEEELQAAQAELAELKSQSPDGLDYEPTRDIDRFWDSWRADFGDTGLVNPRGDRLLTELAIRAMRQLRPRLMMVNYQDTDYVHWGNASHYTRAIAIIDDGLKQIVATADTDPFYAGNTVFVVVPDCGRDTNGLMDIPFQHHFNSKSAHEIWSVVAGPRIDKGRVMDKSVDQSAIAPTIAAIMGFAAHQSEGTALTELFT